MVQQWNQSDLAFLRERARLIQAELWFADNTLHFATRGNRTATTLSLVMGDDLLEAQMRADLAHQRTSVKVSGYDATERDSISEEAGSDAIQAEISGGRTGSAVLQQAFGERVSFRVRGDPLVAGEAQAWARAEMLRRARGFVTVSGMTNGTADMIVGSKLTLDRVGAPFGGDGYYVTRVLPHLRPRRRLPHPLRSRTADGERVGGRRMRIAEHVPDGMAARHFGVYPAIVTDIVDPDSIGRIQVKFPWLGDAGADVRAWATLCTPYADDDQGYRDPSVGRHAGRRGVRGRRPAAARTSSAACWNGRESLPESPATPNNKRLWKTRAESLLEFDDTDGAAKITLSMDSGHKLTLDDSTQEVKLTHSNGCVITFTPAGRSRSRPTPRSRSPPARSTSIARRRPSTA